MTFCWTTVNVNDMEKSLHFYQTVIGLPVQAGPFSPNPSIKFLYVLDPDGLKIQFVENVRH